VDASGGRCPASFAEPDAGVPGAGPGALAATAQGASRVPCQPDAIAASAWPTVTPAARAGSPLANRAARVAMTVALRLWSLPGTGRTPDGPVSGYGRARAAGPGGRFPPLW
jgi:hypothetical protein